MRKATGKNALSLLLALCLLAGCTAGNGPAASGSSTAPPEPPASAGGTPAEPGGNFPYLAGSPEPDTVPDLLPQEDPKQPDRLAGAILYYAPGHRLTLYAMEPETGAIRTVREESFWNGREVECVSPSGSRVLLTSAVGAPTRRAAALSLYDIGADRLVNLERAGERPGEPWKEKHWFPAYASTRYCFADEDTFLYQSVCDTETPGQPHLHLYDIAEDGAVTARLLMLESPREDGGGDWDADCLWSGDEQALLGHLCEEAGSDWVSWDIKTGGILSRCPGKNSGSPIGVYPCQLRDGVIYYTEDDWNRETVTLMACDIREDTLTALASGPLMPGGEAVPEDEEKGRGCFEGTWLEDIREDGSFVLRSAPEPRGNRAFSHFREAVWDPAAGGEIRFGAEQRAPEFPADTVRGDRPIFAAAPDGTGLFLFLPQDMAEYYWDRQISNPYPIAFLPTGELLFLAVSARDILPQEDPERPGRLAGTSSGEDHRMTLYAADPESGQLYPLRGSSFWNGLEPEDVSPSGSRLLLATRDGAEGQRRAALSLYDIRENRLYNLAGPDRKANGGSQWFPGEHRYRFIDEESFLCQELRPNGYGSWYAPRYVLDETGGLDSYYLWVELPRTAGGGSPQPCVYLPEERTLSCRLAAEAETPAWFTWQVTPWESWRSAMDSCKLLSRTPGEDPRLEALLAAADLPPESGLPAGAASSLLPEAETPRFLTELPDGKLLILAKTPGIS